MGGGTVGENGVQGHAPRRPEALSNAVLTATDDDRLGGDEGGIVAGEEENGSSDVPGFAEALDRLADPGFSLLHLGLRLRDDEAGKHRVGGDPVLCDVIGQSANEVDDSHLRGDVVAALRSAVVATR